MYKIDKNEDIKGMSIQIQNKHISKDQNKKLRLTSEKSKPLKNENKSFDQRSQAAGQAKR